jgi:hypothetical protein
MNMKVISILVPPAVVLAYTVIVNFSTTFLVQALGTSSLGNE